MEEGEVIPEEIRKRIEEKVNRSPEEEEILAKAREINNRKEKVFISIRTIFKNSLMQKVTYFSSTPGNVEKYCIHT